MPDIDRNAIGKEVIPALDSGLENIIDVTKLNIPIPETVRKNLTVVTDKGKSLGLEATGDQIIVLQDKFRTGFECKTCDGDGQLDEPCDICNGTGMHFERICSKCTTSNLPGVFLKPGKKICPDCEGKGGLLVAPDIAQRKATSGTVVSCGPQVGYDRDGIPLPEPLQIGHRVLYSIFAGTEIEFKQKAVIRIMHEHEIMCRIWGVEFNQFETVSR